MKKFSLIVALCCTFIAANAQKISGSIRDTQGKPVEIATILLLNATDSTMVKGAVTDLDGNYEMERAAAGNYRISVSSSGFAAYTSIVFAYDGGDKTVDKITLQPLTNELKAVTMTARRPAIEVKSDKTVMNIEGSINATGSNALELLRKAPGVVIDKDDNISLKGKQGVRIYIDGKPSQLDARDLAALLKNTRSTDMGAIELISNPSAKYDAAGTGGVINIRLKKNKKVGFNGTTEQTLAMGITPKYSGAVGLNYRSPKWNVFSNYSYHEGRDVSYMNFYREQSTTAYDQRTVEKSYDIDHGWKLGADYTIDKRNTIGAVVSGNTEDDKAASEGRTVIGAISGATNRVLISDNYQPNARVHGNYNLNYRYADTGGHELAIDADYGTFSGISSSNQPNFYKNAAETQILSNNSFAIDYNNSIKIATLKADYETGLYKGKLGVGAKRAMVTTNNIFNYFNGANESRIQDYDRSNAFTYAEAVTAAYVNYNKTLNKKWSVQAGVRAEETDSRGELTSTRPTDNDIVKRSYLDFFPSAAVTFNLDSINTFGLTYSRRIDRPSYQNLNPFESKLNELSYSKGNPFLRPQYTNSVELSHTFMQFINTSVGYSRTTDFFTEITDTASGGRTFIINKNLATVDNYSFNISAPLPLAKWYNGFINFGANHQSYQANFDGKIIDLQFNSFNAYMQNTFTLPKGWSAELSGFYASPSVWGGSFRTRAFGGMDLGVQKKILKDNGTLKLSVSDVLHTQQWRGVSNYGGVYFVASGGWESQQVRLTFNYRFGNQGFTAREHKTGNESESKRIK